MINVTTAPGSSLAETNKIMGKVGERLKSIPQIRDFQQVAGYGMIAGQGNSYGMCIVRLKDWSERPDKADAVNAVIGQIYARTADIKDAQIFAVAPPMITGYGTSTGFEMYLQDQTGGDITDFYNIYLQYIYALNQRPEIQMAYSTSTSTSRSIWWTSMRRRPSARVSLRQRFFDSATTADSTCRTSTASRKYIA